LVGWWSNAQEVDVTSGSGRVLNAFHGVLRILDKERDTERDVKGIQKM
jgi:hypothetical protein